MVMASYQLGVRGAVLIDTYKMKEGYVKINQVPTKIITTGRWIEEEVEEHNNSKGLENIIVVITGNPGSPNFYSEFIQTLHEQLGYPVWVIGHAGHEVPIINQEFNIPPLEGNEALYNLQGQLDHKVTFIEQYVPKNARVHLIGHSVGAYFIVELLKNHSINSKVTKCYLLFPTLEYMAESPNGIFYNTVAKRCIWLILFLAKIFTVLPSQLQHCLLYIYMLLFSIPKFHLNNLVNLINPEILKKVFFLANDEMNCIKERNTEVILANKSKIKFYYGATDGWVPVSYYEKLKHDIENVEAQLCVHGFDHSFVLKFSKDVGSLVAHWIMEELDS